MIEKNKKTTTHISHVRVAGAALHKSVLQV